MIQEAYISFEVAKLLKEKGFDEKTQYIYRNPPRSTEVFCKDTFTTVRRKNSDFKNEYFETYSAPTQQMAMRWLREVHDIKIMIRPYVDGTYSYEILNGFWYVNFDSYEDAAEAAIKYCLENLVK